MRKFINRLGLALVPLMFAIPGRVYAAPPRIEELGNVLGSVLDLITPIGAVIAVAMIIYGGYMWMMAGGDPGKLKQAQGTLTWSVLGLVFIALTRMILKLVFDFLGS